MLALILSVAKRLITAISTPFRMIIVRVQRMFNINVLSAKLIQPLTKNVKKLLTLRPSDKSDYVRIGGFLVFKRLLELIVLASCAGVFIYFQMFATRVGEAPISLTGIKTDITFSYDDISVQEFTGIANIKSFDGTIVYTGEIDRGVCKGMGFLYARDGRLVYEGAFDNNKYNGYGIKYNPDGRIEYEGEFSDNLYNGTGKLYNARGTLLYSGGFSAGQYDGEGKLYGENGSLICEGMFAAGKSHGVGTQYYSDGTMHYRGEFFQGVFQGRGELFDEFGRLIYTGAMQGGEINYRALAGATLSDVETAFSETPTIFYQEDGNSCYFYEKAGVAITTDCRLKVYEWEREKENPSDGYYYMPGEIDLPNESAPPDASTPPSGSDSSESVFEIQDYYDPDDDESDDESDDDDDYSLHDEYSSGQGTIASAAAPSGERLTVMPMSWLTMDPYDPNPDSSENPSSQESAPPAAPESSGSPDTPESTPPASAPQVAAGNDDSSNSNSGDMPDFVDKTKRLYFEVDKDVWQSEDSLDKTKVFIKRVTVIGGKLPSESGMTPIEDNGPPSVEDCVAIDYIRRQNPTAFSDVSFEMDKQNKLFQRLWSISFADRIIRRAFLSDNITYRFCYEPGNTVIPVYYSIETQ